MVRIEQKVNFKFSSFHANCKPFESETKLQSMKVEMNSK